MFLDDTVIGLMDDVMMDDTADEMMGYTKKMGDGSSGDCSGELKKRILGQGRWVWQMGCDLGIDTQGCVGG